MKERLLRWLGITESLNALDALSRGRCKKLEDAAQERFEELEAAIAALDRQQANEIAELRSEKEHVAKRRPSGRPFSQLQKLAERGAQAEKAS